MRLLSDTNVSVVFVLGQPDIELAHMFRGVKYCWVYDYSWDDEIVEDHMVYLCLDDHVFSLHMNKSPWACAHLSSTTMKSSTNHHCSYKMIQMHCILLRHLPI